ncbi:MAG: hypothetical protein NZ846_07070 [Thermus sp.]|uniref:hypothetical protein n=1 Tax=Thermus sp. TaxID=275 RepID=UPI0025D21F83|nr:hypothetical protein [Thermus sp.]MCS6869756.1 hypothetical protein [Thermus sp.]MCS7218723.1 hypothetical protein [Thermus sp.]MCX7849679.1 hypothetical protein [Thermus sp.]MDW8016982.1 hypothetical protein [Thermus sp.]MDW8358027.1 hypothetical protein [Thermus sp.]
MRVGVLKGFLSRRYLGFWEAYLGALGVEVVRAEVPPDRRQPYCLPVQGLLAQVEALKAQGVDYLLLPDLQGGVESERGGGACPWLLDLEAALLRYYPGLPPVLKVPAELSEKTLGRAGEVGQILTQNPMLVGRALDRAKGLLKPPPPPKTPLGSVGVVAQPYLLEDEAFRQEVGEALARVDLFPYFPDLPPERLREEGQKLLPMDLPTDRELLGMLHYLGRLGRVKGLLLVVSYACPPIPSLLRRAARRLSKPYRLLTLGEDWQEPLRSLKGEMTGEA